MPRETGRSERIETDRRSKHERDAASENTEINTTRSDERPDDEEAVATHSRMMGSTNTARRDREDRAPTTTDRGDQPMRTPARAAQRDAQLTRVGEVSRADEDQRPARTAPSSGVAQEITTRITVIPRTKRRRREPQDRARAA